MHATCRGRARVLQTRRGSREFRIRSGCRAYSRGMRFARWCSVSSQSREGKAHAIPNREGQRVPDVTFRTRENGEWVDVSTRELFAGKTVVVFSLPGAFTPTC